MSSHQENSFVLKAPCHRENKAICNDLNFKTLLALFTNNKKRSEDR